MSDKKGLVLIVDDDEEILEVLTLALKTFGYDVHTEMSTKKSRAWLEANPQVILIISDVMMPDGNGLDFLKWVRAHAKLNKIPMIMCTGLKDIDTQNDALELGAVDFLRKPMKMDVLREKVERLRVRANR